MSFSDFAARSVRGASEGLPRDASASTVLNAATGMKASSLPFVAPGGLAVVLLLFSLALLMKDLANPAALSPFRRIEIEPASGRGRWAVVGGQRVWLLGCFSGAICHVVQVGAEVRYGRLAVVSLASIFWGELAFWIFLTTSLLFVISSLHSIPLLLPTSSYTPPLSLAKPLLAALPTTLSVVLLPLALLLTLAGNFVSTAINVSRLQTDILKRAALEDALGAVLTGARREGTMRVGWVCVVLVAVGLVQTRIWVRLWAMVQNAKIEELRAFNRSSSSTHAPVQREPQPTIPIVFHPLHTLPTVDLSTIPHLPLLPPPIPLRRPSVALSPTLSSDTRDSWDSDEGSDLSFLTPSSSTTKWDDDVCLLAPHEEIGKNVPSFPAAAFLARRARSNAVDEESVWEDDGQWPTTPLFCASSRGTMRRAGSGSSYGTGSETSGGWATLVESDKSGADDEKLLFACGSSSITAFQQGTMSRSSTGSSLGSSNDTLDEAEPDGQEGRYEGPSSECLRDMRDNHAKDAAGVVAFWVVYGAVLESQALFQDRVLMSPSMWVFTTVVLHLLPLLAGLVVLIINLVRDISGASDEELFCKTRWGRRDPNEARSCWIPNEGEAPAQMLGDARDEGKQMSYKEGLGEFCDGQLGLEYLWY